MSRQTQRYQQSTEPTQLVHWSADCAKSQKVDQSGVALYQRDAVTHSNPRPSLDPPGYYADRPLSGQSQICRILQKIKDFFKKPTNCKFESGVKEREAMSEKCHERLHFSGRI